MNRDELIDLVFVQALLFKKQVLTANQMAEAIVDRVILPYIKELNEAHQRDMQATEKAYEDERNQSW